MKGREGELDKRMGRRRNTKRDEKKGGKEGTKEKKMERCDKRMKGREQELDRKEGRMRERTGMMRRKILEGKVREDVQSELWEGEERERE